jgi:hypothetical protein
MLHIYAHVVHVSDSFSPVSYFGTGRTVLSFQYGQEVGELFGERSIFVFSLYRERVKIII